MNGGANMTIRAALKRLVLRGVEPIIGHREEAVRDRRNVDIFLSAALRGSEALSEIRDPAAYVNFLRSCIEHFACSVREVKAKPRVSDGPAKRFATLVDILGSSVPPIDFSAAQEIALIADRNGGLLQPLESERWAGDVGLHFWFSSSLGRKGRILSSIIRIARSERCLELGTGYGMSALFILETLRANGGSGHLTTLEGAELQFSIASATLKSHYGDMVSCHLGMTPDTLPELGKSLGEIDFLFHDAGHSREDYVRDFEALRGILVPGAVVLFDDILWEDPRFPTGRGRTYEGWREIVRDSRVQRALEIDGSLGLLLLR